jgi:hypothetical protein
MPAVRLLPRSRVSDSQAGRQGRYPGQRHRARQYPVPGRRMGEERRELAGNTWKRWIDQDVALKRFGKVEEIADCGKRGDQIVRLFDTPANLFVIQYVGPIADLLIKDVRGKAANLQASGKDAYFLIMDAQDTARVLHAYGKL